MNHLIRSRMPYRIDLTNWKRESSAENLIGLFLKKVTQSAWKSDFSLAHNCGRDQQYYTKIAKRSILLGLEPRIF